MNSLGGIRRSSLATAAAVALAVAVPAHAKRVFIDFGVDNLETSGNGWDTNNSFEADRTGDRSCDGSPCTAIPLGFNINFGQGLVGSLFINENGAVTFGSPLTEGSFTSSATLAGLGRPVIAPFYADLISTAPDGTVFDVTNGEILYSRGIADPDEDQNGVYSVDSAVTAFHTTWAGPTVGNDPTLIFTDLVIYSRGSNGDFDIRFGYGTLETPIMPALGSIAGFALGSNVNQFTGPYDSAHDFYFQFRGGSAVPAPAAGWLLMTGMAAIGLRMRRRKPRSA